MSNIERFNLRIDRLACGEAYSMQPQDGGPWIKYEDHTASVSSLQAQVKELTEERDELRQMFTHANTMQDFWCNKSKGLAGKADTLRAQVKELREERERQMDYAIDLQRIIEDLCKGRDIRTPQTAARHHYDMAVDCIRRARALKEGETTVEAIEPGEAEAGQGAAKSPA